MKLRHISVGLVALLTLAPLAACSSGGGDGDDKTIVVFAGQGMGPAMEELVGAFNAEVPDFKAEVVLGSNPELIDKIRAEEKFDLYAATKSGVKPVVDEGLVQANPVEIGSDPIQIAVALNNPKQITSLSVFGEDEGVVAGLCPESASCGSAARRVLTKAGITPAPDVLAENGGTLLEQVVNGEVDAALLFRTQIINRNSKVSAVDVPEGSDVENTYVIARSSAGEKVLAFLDWLENAPTANRILRNRGLLPQEGRGAAARPSS